MIRLVTDYLDNTVKRFPNKVSISGRQEEITFEELSNRSRSIASFLICRGYFRSPVVVFMDKSPAMIVSFIGVAYSGNFYTPIDNSTPDARIEKIIEVLKPCMVITDVANRERANSIFGGLTTVLYDEMIRSEVDDKAISERRKEIIDTDLLYVLFTSGSTGIPKGVSICHRSVIDYSEWVTDTFNIDEEHVFGNQAPFYFDNSILDIYQMMKTGAQLDIIPDELFSFPIKLLEYISQKRINIIFWVPSALCVVANLKALGKRDISCLKKILFCGEVMPVKQLNMWRRELPEALLANLYGPTEITDVCTYYIIDREFENDDSLPIGKACENTEILILDEDRQVEDGEIGELCVKGTCLAMGYYNDPVKTAESFVKNPLNNRYPEIIYRTGDLVRLNENGEILFCGRKDYQIKHMGHRIELGEIEAAAGALDGINECCAVYNEKRKKIYLFYVGDITEDSLKSSIESLLPDYMLPSVFQHESSLPKNQNGKIDRKKILNVSC